MAISNRALARLGEKYARVSRLGGVGYHVDRTTRIVKETAEVVGGGALIGFVRGKLEDKASGQWELPMVKGVDAELLIGAGGALLAFVGARHLGGFDKDLSRVSSGILAHYAGQVARKYASTGTLTVFAGAGEPPAPQLAGESVEFGADLSSVLRDTI